MEARLSLHGGYTAYWRETLTWLATFQGHVVKSAMFSPDGQYVLTASEDKTANIYLSGTDVSALFTMVACRIPRGLTNDEVNLFQIRPPLRFQRTQDVCPPAFSPLL